MEVAALQPEDLESKINEMKKNMTEKLHLFENHSKQMTKSIAELQECVDLKKKEIKFIEDKKTYEL